MSISASQKDIKTLYQHLKRSASKRGIDFDLNITDLYNITFPISCPVLGIPLEFHNNEAQDNSYSFDRIDSTKGYTIDNLIIVSNRVNKIKSNASIDELRKIADYYHELQKQQLLDLLTE